MNEAEEIEELQAALDVTTTFLKCIIMECPSYLNFGKRAQAVLSQRRVKAAMVRQGVKS